MTITINAYEFSETVTTTEWSLTTDTAGPDADTADGVYQCLLDLSALAAGDEYEFKIYEKALAAGTQRECHRATFIGAQSPPDYPSPAITLGHGWDMTLKKIAGTDRNIDWSIRKIS